MFRLQDNVPEIYVQASRDFQLFCRLYDAVQGSVKFSTDSLATATSTKSCNTKLLELLKTKVGLFSTTVISEDNLRLVIDAFPHIMRNKGSLRGINYVLNLFSRLTDESESVKNAAIEVVTSSHTIKITFPVELKNDQLLIELLKLILPTGYMLSYSIATMASKETVFNVSSKLKIHHSTDNKKFNAVYSKEDYTEDDKNNDMYYDNEVLETEVANNTKEQET